jgi:hypothetical protein
MVELGVPGSLVGGQSRQLPRSTFMSPTAIKPVCRVLAAFMTAGLLTACDLPSPKPKAKGEVLESSHDLAIGYGSLGPAKVGMNKGEALNTGLFSRQKYDPSKTCKPSALKWKKPFKGVEVRTDTAGTIRSLGILRPGPKTQNGIQVGSDLADVRAAHGSALIGPAKTGRKLSVGYVKKEGAWIGFLFDDDPEDEVLDPIIFIEVTKGSKPQLQRTC